MREGKESMLTAVLLVTLVVLISSTVLAEAADPLLWPFQEGQWVEFLVQSPSEANLWNAQIKVTSTTIIGGNQYYGVEIPKWGQGTQETVLLRSTEKGVYRLEADGECTVVDLEQSGATFRCRTAAGGWEVTANLASGVLEVPVGPFANVYLFRKHIEYDDGSMSPDWDIYMVPGVGLVKQVDYDGNFRDGQPPPGVTRSMELAQLGTPPELSAKGIQSAPAVTPEPKAESPSTETVENSRRVATFGTIVEVRASTFILKQESLKVSPRKNAIVHSVKHDLAIGSVGNHLEVLTDSATQIVIGGTSTSLSALRPGTRVFVAGTAEGTRLRADIISNFSEVRPPSKEEIESSAQRKESSIQGKEFMTPAPSALPLALTPLAPGSMCWGQDMDYDNEPNVLEFQGCLGGPSASDIIYTYDVPISCPGWVFGCFDLHSITYTAGLLGWGFDFPLEFSASSSDLTYHVPSSVTMSFQPRPARPNPGAFTFA